VKTLDPVLYQIRKESILQQARHLFSTKGYAESSMDDIAHANHMQKASLYHYFNSKHQILQEMIEWEGARWAARLRDVPPRLTFQESLTHLAKAFLKNIDDASGREFFRIIYFESSKHPSILKAFKETPTYKDGGPIFEAINAHLGNRLSRLKIAMLTMQFVGSLIHYARMSRLHGENMCGEGFSDDQYLEQAIGVFARGVESV
jgi:AcrR family transcriptional regulator